MAVEIKLAYDAQEEVSALFREYTAMLLENDPSFAEYLAIQHYDAEVRHLEDKYGLPSGRLYIAWVDEQAVGCIGLRRLDATRCEMKRLYVRPGFRGHHLARRLVETILDDARAIGYREMLLDTLPFLENAIELYRRFGFYETGAYNDSPMDTTIYMKLDL